MRYYKNHIETIVIHTFVVLVLSPSNISSYSSIQVFYNKRNVTIVYLSGCNKTIDSPTKSCNSSPVACEQLRATYLMSYFKIY